MVGDFFLLFEIFLYTQRFAPETTILKHTTGPTATASDTGRAIEATADCPDAQRKQSHGGEPLKTLHGAGRTLTCQTPT